MFIFNIAWVDTEGRPAIISSTCRGGQFQESWSLSISLKWWLGVFVIHIWYGDNDIQIDDPCTVKHWWWWRCGWEVNEQVVHHLTMPLDTLKPFSDDGHNLNDDDDNLMMMIKMIIIITKKGFRSPKQMPPTWWESSFQSQVSFSHLQLFIRINWNLWLHVW